LHLKLRAKLDKMNITRGTGDQQGNLTVSLDHIVVKDIKQW